MENSREKVEYSDVKITIDALSTLSESLWEKIWELKKDDPTNPVILAAESYGELVNLSMCLDDIRNIQPSTLPSTFLVCYLRSDTVRSFIVDNTPNNPEVNHVNLQVLMDYYL